MPIETIVLIAASGLAAREVLGSDESMPGSQAEFDGWFWPMRTLNVGSAVYMPSVSDTYSAVKTATHREHHGCDIMFRRKAGGGPDQMYPRNGSEGTANYFCPHGLDAICPRDGKIYNCGIGGKGEWAIIDCGKPIAIFMTHLRGLRVSKGQGGRGGATVIGTVAFSPEDSQKLNHMHLEVWRNGPSSAHVDPMPYLTKAKYS